MPTAKMIGAQETVEVNGVKQKVSVSFVNRYSIVNATKVNISPDKKSVAFSISDQNGHSKKLNYPLFECLNLKARIDL